ncbi:MAG: hypothetical protein AB8I08_19565 [Sandaracinaceae bacterium]
MTSTRLLLGALLLCLVGCGESHGVRDAALPTDASMPTSACLAACEARFDPETASGWCALDDCPGECAAVARQSLAAQTQLESCLIDNPLCFETLDACVLFGLHDERVAAPVDLLGVGLSDWDGLTVFAHVRQSSETSPIREAVVVDGGFMLALGPIDAQVQSAGLEVEGFIDVDGDGLCSEADVPLREFTQREGTFDSPRYEASFAGPSDADLTFVCDRFRS